MFPLYTSEDNKSFFSPLILCFIHNHWKEKLKLWWESLFRFVSIRKLTPNYKWFQTQIPRNSTENRERTSVDLENAVPVQFFLNAIEMRSDLHQGSHWNCSLVKEVRAISETKKTAVNFIRLQESHNLQHTSSFQQFWTPSTFKGINSSQKRPPWARVLWTE